MFQKGEPEDSVYTHFVFTGLKPVAISCIRNVNAFSGRDHPTHFVHILWHQGLRQLMLKWGLFKKNSAVVGIELQEDGMALAALHWVGGQPIVSHMTFLAYTDGASAEHMLKEWVTEAKLGDASCYVTLASDQYQILLVEPPEVPEEELRGAIRWRLKDLISIPLEQAAIDVFALPDDGTRSKKRMVYVVAAHEQKIRSVIALIKDGGLSLQAIDVGELAMRNVANTLLNENNSERGIAVARIRRGGGSVYIYRQGNMYLARSFALDYQAGLLDDLPEETLALELQRSVDYYERQMGQSPPTVIYVCGENVLEDKLGAVLKASLGIPIQLLDPTAVVGLSAEADAGASQRCLAAIGAALRQEQVN